MVAFDRRLIPARKDLVAAHLKSDFNAPRTAQPAPAHVTGAVVDLRPEPDARIVADTQLLFGETISVFEHADGWAWVQSIDDGYVGYVRSEQIADGAGPGATHRIATLGTNVYAEPSLKTPTVDRLPFAARVHVAEVHNGYARIASDRWLPEPHLAQLGTHAPDWVSVAEMFLGAPYLWGGRSNLGLDCSALIQLARQAGGFRCLRDSDMQEASEGTTLAPDAALRRGDLLFWRGHVGVMSDHETLLHANGHHMAVVHEPLAEAIQRIQDSDGGPVTRRARLNQSV